MIKAVVAYDGSNYAGWQKQENALGIQEVMERALYKIHHFPSEVVASGRTDAKVHALGQVIHFYKQENISAEQYRKALNGLLPKDIRILSCTEIADDFHARFSAKSKHYDYICTYKIDDPFAYPYKCFLYKKLDLNQMEKAKQSLLGTHDYTSYSSCKIDSRKPRIKTIHQIDIKENGSDILFSFYGTGFLRYQVRMMVGTLLAVGEGKIPPEKVKEILEAQDKHACRFNAPPQGLYLVEVKYEQ